MAGPPGGEVDDDESIRAMHAALDMGMTMFGPAAVYGIAHSDRVFAKALCWLLAPSPDLRRRCLA